VGLDGFVDTIVTPVGLRSGQGEAFTPISTLTDFGQRIMNAAGKSTNIELYPRLDKLGGNGPIMAHALLAHGAQLTYVGALGAPAIHPVFAPLAARARVVSVTDPAHTTAVEFTDGKLMLGQMRSLDAITFESLLAQMGEAGLAAELAAADLVALVNWTMIPHMTSIFKGLLENVLPKLPKLGARFFFDLADPEKRSTRTSGTPSMPSHVSSRSAGLPSVSTSRRPNRSAPPLVSPAEVKTAPRSRRPPRRCASGCKSMRSWCIPAPRRPARPPPVAHGSRDRTPSAPLITTGAGDHFNAGFSTGQLLGLDPESCLATGVCTSGHYVRTGESPTLAQIETFLANWR
jgi:hypothetical protein